MKFAATFSRSGLESATLVANQCRNECGVIFSSPLHLLNMSEKYFDMLDSWIAFPFLERKKQSLILVELTKSGLHFAK
jgi:hypothetical protein